ncbi:MAG TPA: 16S rRNA (cytosine(1402)-N(4))-methyltransferase RsmH [Candidatus Onthocola stercorigallinarum]|nr:16S rRNA (cytosine(1402)-N(4))-methyltransferase RsmH [Candidatus Onthocola stercorigallinarum]
MMHYSVLKQELIESLNIKEDGIYVDATLGYAGDSKEILKRIKKGCLVCFDQDKEACEYSDKVLKDIGSNYKIFNTNFVNMVECLESIGIEYVDGIIFDLGFSSPQIDNAKRGFSFMQDGPLDMRMSSTGISAKEIIDTYSIEDLSKIFFEYGEEKMSRVIAKKVNSNKNSINTTLDLVAVIKDAVGANYFYKHHPERKIFQALRIAVNNELKVLEDILPESIKLLKKGGRLAVITFHSKEDRIVKQIFKKYSEVDEMLRGERNIPDEYKPLIKLVNKKPIIPSKKELAENSRSASAKLRIIERI